MVTPVDLSNLSARLAALEAMFVSLDDRVRAVEEQSVDHENRLEDLESKRDKDAYIESD